MIREAENKHKIEYEKKTEALNIEKINILIAEESLKLSRVEEVRANNRKRYKEELRRAFKISMQAQ